MTIKEKIEASQVYSFYARHPKYLDGTGLTAMQLIEAFANAKIDTKKARCINKICDYLKSKYTILCDDEHLHKVVSKAYDKIGYYERMEYDFNNLHPCCIPWYHMSFQKRMHSDI